MSDQIHTWVSAYGAIADAVLARRNDRTQLLAFFTEMTGIERDDIDPFTFFIAFNRRDAVIDRYAWVKKIMREFGVDAPLPRDFVGIPTANHDLWQYYDDSPQGIEDCWQLLAAALAVAENANVASIADFSEAFDKVHQQENINKAKLTRALYWARPRAFLPLGNRMRTYLHDRYGLNIPEKMTGLQYLRRCEEALAVIDEPFFQVTAKAFRIAEEDVWWPQERDFCPRYHAQQWLVLLGDDELVSPDSMKALKRMYQMGGEATPHELASEFGKDSEFYRLAIEDFAKAASKFFDQKPYKGSYWTVVASGRSAPADRKGDYVWKLRPELLEALGMICS